MKEWNDKYWKIQVYNDTYHLRTPNTTFIFNREDFLELYRNISAVAEEIYTKDTYYIHDNQVYNRETGEQFIGAIDDCEEMNRLHTENLKLQAKITELEKKEYKKDD